MLCKLVNTMHIKSHDRRRNMVSVKGGGADKKKPAWHEPFFFFIYILFFVFNSGVPTRKFHVTYRCKFKSYEIGITLGSNQVSYPNHVDTKCILMSVMESCCPKSRCSEKNRVIKTDRYRLTRCKKREVDFSRINVVGTGGYSREHTKVFLFSIFSM